MKAFIDRKLLQLLTVQSDADAKDLTPVKARIDAVLKRDDQPIQILLSWPTLLEYLDLGSLLAKFPPFDKNNGLFAFLMSPQAEEAESELLVQVYDQIFVECLTDVKGLPQVDQSFLLDQIQKKRLLASSQPFLGSLEFYEKLLIENPYHTMHDLILYLAWDRVCVYIATAFESIPANPKAGKVLTLLRDCLVESFQHITQQGRTRPGFFRVVEALYALNMRPDRMQEHDEAQWLLLSKGSVALQPRERLADTAYVDTTVIAKQLVESGDENPMHVFTMVPAATIEAGLDLARATMARLGSDVPGWQYTLGPVEVVCLKEAEDGLTIDRVVSR
jgi:hypothetical protein